MSDCGCHQAATAIAQRRVLVWLLLINATMFITEGITGWLAQSTALMADSLDMLADAVVYGLSLYAVTRSMDHKRRAAMVSGGFQMALALVVLADGMRRFWLGTEPLSGGMVAMGGRHHRSGGAPRSPQSGLNSPY